MLGVVECLPLPGVEGIPYNAQAQLTTHSPYAQYKLLYFLLVAAFVCFSCLDTTSRDRI